MGFFDLLRGADINQLHQVYSKTEKALLLDVRTPSEFGNGHIPGSKNVPLDVIDHIGCNIADKDVPIFVYCHSGARSRLAAKMLNKCGYSSVVDMGGISRYSGELER
ncbi:MAG: rhodanese-like domain-containing protein [Oscillospiraceae bacterium]|nr:rhodanese-like domain-containing protein [Oscillospiraceae bacterium]MBQ4538565.1 rhodanese-like domain-containing protein [Oscillospiraceae bacterium]